MKVVEGKEMISREHSSYLSDESGLSGSSKVLFFPENTEDVKEVLSSHNSGKNPLTVSNGKTGITGGAVPFDTDLISLEKMDRIIGLKNGRLLVEAGVSLMQIEEFLLKNDPDLFYPIDVTETSARIGGTIATDASGGRSYHYGSTRKWVSSIKVILANGEELFIPRGKFISEGARSSINEKRFDLPKIKILSVKNVAGYFIKENMDLIDLFIGNEGTLGIITEAELRLAPRPKQLLVIVAFFSSEEDAFAFFFDAEKNLKEALTFEFFDENSLHLLRGEFPVGGYRSAILFEINENEEDLLKTEELLKRHNSDLDKTWMGENRKEVEKIRDFRHKLPEIINSIIAKSRNRYPDIHKISTDIAVPQKYLRKMIDHYHAVMNREKIAYALFGHIGESHLHLNMMPEDDDQFQRAKKIYRLFIEKAVSLGGTFAAEHGVGRLKKEYLPLLYSDEEIKGMLSIKRELDPNMILNPGVMFVVSP
ncbi:MAG: FAD-binding oxidoreductase [Spirochaetes bacterium]|nr:FAD-binding oxidoreductase [Spirochaetota bacterium]